MKEREQRKE